MTRPPYCHECGSPAVADLDAPAGIWVCDECGTIQQVTVADILGPAPNFADEHWTEPRRAETITPDPEYL